MLQVDLVDLVSCDLISFVIDGDEEDILSYSFSQVSVVLFDFVMDLNDGIQVFLFISDSFQIIIEGFDLVVIFLDSFEIVLDGIDNQYLGLQIGQFQDEDEEVIGVFFDEVLEVFRNFFMVF